MEKQQKSLQRLKQTIRKETTIERDLGYFCELRRDRAWKNAETLAPMGALRADGSGFVLF